MFSFVCSRLTSLVSLNHPGFKPSHLCATWTHWLYDSQLCPRGKSYNSTVMQYSKQLSCWSTSKAFHSAFKKNLHSGCCRGRKYKLSPWVNASGDKANVLKLRLVPLKSRHRLSFSHQDEKDFCEYTTGILPELHVKKYILLWRQNPHLSPHLW